MKGLKWERLPSFLLILVTTSPIKVGLEYQYESHQFFVSKPGIPCSRVYLKVRWYSQDTFPSPWFFPNEHSDGANYCMFTFVKWFVRSSPVKMNFIFRLVLRRSRIFNCRKRNTRSWAFTGMICTTWGRFYNRYRVRLKFPCGNFIPWVAFKGLFVEYPTSWFGRRERTYPIFSAHWCYLVGNPFSLWSLGISISATPQFFCFWVFSLLIILAILKIMVGVDCLYSPRLKPLAVMSHS